VFWVAPKAIFRYSLQYAKKESMRKEILFLGIVLFLAMAMEVIFVVGYLNERMQEEEPGAKKIIEVIDTIEVALDKSIMFNVPFSPQAPFANWLDSRQNYACEEASALMAVKWAKGEQLSLAEAEETIIAMSEWQSKHYGYFQDTSAQDTVDRIFKEYFDYHNVMVRSGIDADHIKQALWDGNVVIAPVRGRELANPYYTPPGPLIHMVLVVGYDKETREFITNDPGTRRGEKLRYKEELFENALQDYASGHNEPLEESDKVMIVISPEYQVGRFLDNATL
jgi:hypothetical protein